jgi:hypothetical protein
LEERESAAACSGKENGGAVSKLLSFTVLLFVLLFSVENLKIEAGKTQEPGYLHKVRLVLDILEITTP